MAQLFACEKCDIANGVYLILGFVLICHNGTYMRLFEYHYKSPDIQACALDLSSWTNILQDRILKVQVYQSLNEDFFECP